MLFLFFSPFCVIDVKMSCRCDTGKDVTLPAVTPGPGPTGGAYRLGSRCRMSISRNLNVPCH